MKRLNSTLVLIISILILSITILALPVSAAIMPSVDISDISKLGTAPTVTATYREVDAENGVFALDFAVANTDFCYLGLYLGFDVNSIVTCQPDGSAATGLKKTKALEVAQKTLDGLDEPVSIDDAEYGWGAFTIKSFDPTNGSLALGLGRGLQSEEMQSAHGIVNGIMPASTTPYHVYTVYFKTVGDTTLSEISSEMFVPRTHLVEPWNGSTVYTDPETIVDVPITYIGLPLQPGSPKPENLLGTPMLGNNIDELIGEGLGGYDAGHCIAQYFKVTEDGSIPQVRYYFPTDFLDYYNVDEYTFDFKITLWERKTDNLLTTTYIDEETITATITEDDLGWYVFTLSSPFPVYKDTLYGISVYKGVNGYVGVGNSMSGDFEGKINSPFERPTDGFGAWNNDPTYMPIASYELLGGRFWGTDPVYSSKIIEESSPFRYKVNEDGTTATITGYNGTSNEGINIPESIDGYTVKYIDEYAFSDRSDLSGPLTIPNSVTVIGIYAFKGCSGLTGSLVIPDSVTSIGGSAFLGCSGFTGNLVIPDSVTYITDDAFLGCSGFTGNLVIPSDVVVIGNGAFWGCSGFTGDLVIPSRVAFIGDSSFRNCSSIEKVTIYSKTARFYESAFENTHPDFEIHGYTGSTAETYANDNNHTFVALDESATVSFAGKLCAFMDSLYIRYYFNTDANSENVDYMGTLLMSKDDYEAGEYTELTLENATINLKAENSADDQYASLGNFALQTVYAKDINTVYKARPYVVLRDGSVYYGDTEEYGLSVYLNNQLNKDTATAIYKKLLNHILEYGNIMQEYINR